MEFQHLSESVSAVEADLLAFTTFGDLAKDSLFKQIDGTVHGLLSEAATAEAFEGKTGQVLTVRAANGVKARRVVVIGAGPKTGFHLPNVRDLAAHAAAAAARYGAKHVAFLLPPSGNREALAVQLAVEGVIGGTYRFDKYLTGEDAKKPSPIQTFSIMTDPKGKKPAAAPGRALKAAILRGEVVGKAVCRARNYINEPAQHMTPSQLAEEAKEIAKASGGALTVKVLGAKDCEKLGMGMFLAVGRGSDQEPKLIHLTYTPAKKAKKRIALVGKGVTFDSGGYSLKPSQGMEDMKVDMSGAAAVISAMGALAELGSEHEIHGIAACCENLVSGRAYKLGDVLVAMDGTTVEINNTDAEGRLTLGDAITYARTKVEANEIIDFATLTGACMVALGPYTAGVMSEHESVLKPFLAAAERTGEDMWRLPLNVRLKEQLKSNVADMRNTGDRFGGAITAGLFLKTFARDTPWIHVDIAGPASVQSARPAVPRGGTGFAVATIVDYLAKA
jgi:leucyl aminopeptidase